MKTLEDRIDRLDTATRRKNLVLDGITENHDGKDNFGPLLQQLFNQIGITKNISYDTCHRVGPLNKRRCRPIIISFLTQADRDEVYARRINMKKTADFHDVWLNEDLGQNSRCTNTLIRPISREANRQGIPHKPSKFAIEIDNKKYNEKNFEELPPQLTLHDVKTIRIGSALAYQSEHSKFSNFHPCTFKVGKHIYNSVEQAYHHIRARHANMINILFLADSRGYALENRFNEAVGNDPHINIQWISCPGGTIQEVVSHGIQLVENQRFHQIYLLAGINDLTCKLGHREVTPIFNNWCLLVKHTMIQLYTARQELYKLSNTLSVRPLACISVCITLAAQATPPPPPAERPG